MAKSFVEREKFKKCPFTEKTVLICALAVTVLLLGRSVIHWGCWYLILRVGKNGEDVYFLGHNYYDWAQIGQKIQSFLPILYGLFAVVMGGMFVSGKISPKGYVYGLLAFVLIPLTAVYLFMVLFDPDGATGGLEALISIPYRKERWLLSLACGGVGLFIWRKRKYPETKGIPACWRDPDLKLVVVFAAIALLLRTAVFASDWIPWYLILKAGKDTVYSKVFGFTMADWLTISGRLQMVLCAVSVLLTVLFGTAMLIRRFSVKTYLAGLLLFYLIQVWFCYILNVTLDPGGMTNAVDHLLHLPLRYQRWGIAGVFVICKSVLAFMRRQE